MLNDSQHFFSDEQAITADANSTNVVNLSAVSPGPGNALRLKAHITESFNNLTSLTFRLDTCAVEGFGSGVKNHQSITVALAGLTAGQVIDLGEVPDGALQFARLNYDVTGTNPAAGKVTALVAPLGSDQTIIGQE